MNYSIRALLVTFFAFIQCLFAQNVQILSGASTIDIKVISSKTGKVYYCLYNAAQSSITTTILKADASKPIANPILKNGSFTIEKTQKDSLTTRLLSITENTTSYIYVVFEDSLGVFGSINNKTVVAPRRLPEKSYIVRATNPDIKGRAVRYLLYQPEAYLKDTSSKKYPVMIFFHGDGEKGSNIDLVRDRPVMKIIKDGKELDFLIAAPQQNWPIAWLQAGFLDEFLDSIKSIPRVDTNRIYLSSFSGGGGGFYYMATNHAKNIAAMIPVGTVNYGAGYCAIKDIPLWGFHAQNDNTVTVNNLNAVVNGMNACIPKPIVTPKKTISATGGHTDAPFGNFDMYKWVIGFTKPTPTNKQPIITNNLTVNALISSPFAEITPIFDDPDGSIKSLSYYWYKLSGGDITIENQYKPKLVVRNFTNGTYVFRVVVTDSLGASNFLDINLTISSSVINNPPIVYAGNDEVIHVPTDSYDFDGNTLDNGGIINTTQWSQISGPNTSTILNKNSLNATATGLVAGTYVFRLTVIDNNTTARTDEVTVVVNNLPTINITSPADNLIVSDVAQINVLTSTLDIDGSISYVAFFDNGIEVLDVFTPPFNGALGSLSIGNHEIKAIAYDNLGGSKSASINVIVSSTPLNFNQPSQEIEAKSNEYYFTNPVEKEILIQNAPSDLSYAIYDYKTSLVLTGQSNKIDVSTLKSGLYFLKVKEQNIYKFIKY